MTAEEFVREKIRVKQEIKGNMFALWVYSINGNNALEWCHEYASKCLLEFQQFVDKLDPLLEEELTHKEKIERFFENNQK